MAETETDVQITAKGSPQGILDALTAGGQKGAQPKIEKVGLVFEELAKVWEECANSDPGARMYLRRIGPSEYEGRKVKKRKWGPFSIDDLPDVSALPEWMADEYGGGQFKLQVVGTDGKTKKTATLWVDGSIPDEELELDPADKVQNNPEVLKELQAAEVFRAKKSKVEAAKELKEAEGDDEEEPQGISVEQYEQGLAAARLEGQQEAAQAARISALEELVKNGGGGGQNNAMNTMLLSWMTEQTNIRKAEADERTRQHDLALARMKDEAKERETRAAADAAARLAEQQRTFELFKDVVGNKQDPMAAMGAAMQMIQAAKELVTPPSEEQPSWLGLGIEAAKAVGKAVEARVGQAPAPAAPLAIPPQAQPQRPRPPMRRLPPPRPPQAPPPAPAAEVTAQVPAPATTVTAGAVPVQGAVPENPPQSPTPAPQAPQEEMTVYENEAQQVSGEIVNQIVDKILVEMQVRRNPAPLIAMILEHAPEDLLDAIHEAKDVSALQGILAPYRVSALKLNAIQQKAAESPKTTKWLMGFWEDLKSAVEPEEGEAESDSGELADDPGAVDHLENSPSGDGA
jgi:hypothetical protein